MRTISFILAFGFVLAGPSIAGWSDKGVPGIGTFSYNAAPGGSDTPQRIAALSRQQAKANN